MLLFNYLNIFVITYNKTKSRLTSFQKKLNKKLSLEIIEKYKSLIKWDSHAILSNCLILCVVEEKIYIYILGSMRAKGCMLGFVLVGFLYEARSRGQA